jgi:hypothetical protein
MLKVVKPMGSAQENAQSASADLLVQHCVFIQFNLVGIGNIRMDARWWIKIRAYRFAQSSRNPAKPNPANAARLKQKHEHKEHRSAGTLN